MCTLYIYIYIRIYRGSYLQYIQVIVTYKSLSPF